MYDEATIKSGLDGCMHYKNEVSLAECEWVSEIIY